VNAKAAIDMVKDGYSLLPPMVIMMTENLDTEYPIPDNESMSQSHSIYMDAGISKVESVTLMLNLNHENLGDVTIEITSPGGTKSIILPVNNNLEGYTYGISQSARYLTNAFYGENSKGNWSVKVIDTAALNTGTLNKIQLEISGH
jgi:subtilisin-like proprotein convertase family protein